MKTSEMLEKAVGELDRRGWCQGEYQKPDGRVCAVGAVQEALRVIFGISDADRGPLYDCDVVSEKRVEYSRARQVAVRALHRQVPRAHDYAAAPETFNDLDSTTVEDIKMMFKQAIEERRVAGD